MANSEASRDPEPIPDPNGPPPVYLGYEPRGDRRANERNVKKLLGNMMLLSPCLLHSFNACNMNIILEVGRLLWSEQTYLAVKKGTGPQDA